MSTISNKQHGTQIPNRKLCPQARLSRPTRQYQGRQIVDITTYTPYFLSAVNNALSRGASQQYLQDFGVGIVEWRVISMLAIEPRISASRVCEIVNLDKAGTSRALKRLQEQEYVNFEASQSDPRRKFWWLNSLGYELHDKILNVALKRERQLIEGVEPADLEIFLKVIRKMRKNVDHLESQCVTGQIPV
ncbi:MAG: MarR family winged helix-turn-helix transcriptional regulator [Rhizobiaceae bacterium]|nr:MarR family winged helix-turn-helix transcriptional regulator [Rhizobiaceae bacterium]